MLFDQNDVESVALTACKEARGDGIDACRYVMWVISNRAWDWSETVHSVVYAKNQFTSMSVPSDPEFNWHPTASADVAIYNQCLNLAPDILRRTALDPTQGSHYYANMRTETSGWFARNIAADPVNHPLRVTEGNQSFFA